MVFRSTEAAPEIPESESVAVKWTRTGPLFQPFPFAALRVSKTAGGVLSILIRTDADAASPAALAAVHSIVTPAVSLVKLVTPHPVDEVMLDSGSWTVQL